MLRKALVLVVVACLGGPVIAQKDKDKDKDKDKGKEAKKPGTLAKVLKIDVDKKVLSLELVGGKKKMDVLVNKDTKFFGPRGGKRAAGIKDDALREGAEVRLVLAADGKTAAEVHLPSRKGKKKDKPKDKDKDKPKDKDKKDKDKT